jgi:hypothetical protein
VLSTIPLPHSVSGLAFLTIIVVGVGTAGAIIGLSPLRPAILKLTPDLLLTATGLRTLFGASILVTTVFGLLPTTFGVVDGLSHVTAGFLALCAAFVRSRNPEHTRLVWVANLFGIADILMVATTISFSLLPTIGLKHPIMYAVFLPAPLWLWMHLLSIRNAISLHQSRAVSTSSLAA